MVESEAMQFYQQAQAQFREWLSDDPNGPDARGLRAAIERCDEAMEELRELKTDR